MKFSSIVAIYFLFFSASAFVLLPFGVKTSEELGQEATTPAQDQEFVLAHADNVQATGFVEHLKLPHYVDFQAELALLRQLQREWQENRAAATSGQEAAE